MYYTLVNAEGKVLSWVACMLCATPQDAVAVQPNNGNCCFATGYVPNDIVAATIFGAIFDAEGLITKCCHELWSGFYVAETDCEAIHHETEGLSHAIADSDISIGRISKFDVDFFTQELISQVDITECFDLLMTQAIRNGSSDLCHTLQLVCPDSQLSADKISLLYASCDAYQRQRILHFVVGHGLISDIAALAHALMWNLDYDTYLSRVDIRHEDKYVHHDLLLALNTAEWPQDLALDIFHRLQRQGLSIDSEILTLKSPVLYQEPEYALSCIVSNSEILREIIRLAPDGISQETWRDFFIDTFRKCPMADWGFFPQDIAISCVWRMAHICCHGSPWFPQYLKIYFADIDALRNVFMHIFDKNQTATWYLVGILPDGIIPDDWCQTARLAFRYYEDAHFFTADYLRFLDTQLGIRIGAEWYIRHFYAGRIHYETMIWLLTCRDVTDSDWNHAYAVPVDSILARSARPTYHLMEFLFFVHGTAIDVPSLAHDIGLELDYDALRLILASVSIADMNCASGHDICRYINLAADGKIYSAIRNLRYMRPEMVDMAEIWSAVKSVRGECQIVMQHQPKYYRACFVTQDHSKLRNHNHIRLLTIGKIEK